jgi:hypothetical protein
MVQLRFQCFYIVEQLSSTACCATRIFNFPFDVEYRQRSIEGLVSGAAQAAGFKHRIHWQ